MSKNLRRNILATFKKGFRNMIRLVQPRAKGMPGMPIDATRSMSCPDFQRVFKSYCPSRYAAQKAWSQTSISQPCRAQRAPSRRQYNNLHSPPLCYTSRSALDFQTAGCCLDCSNARFAKGYSTSSPVWNNSTAHPVRSTSNALSAMNYHASRSTDCSPSRMNAPCWSSMLRKEEPYCNQQRSECDPARQSRSLSYDALNLAANLLPNFCYPGYIPPTNTTASSNKTKCKEKMKSNSVADMVNTFACAGAASCDKPKCPCPSCTPACGCCLPPPGNVPPQCIQYIHGYYYYPYGTWFCGPYHVNTGGVKCCCSD